MKTWQWDEEKYLAVLTDLFTAAATIGLLAHPAKQFSPEEALAIAKALMQARENGGQG